MRSGKKKMWTLRGFIVAVITLLLIIFAGVAVAGSAVIAGATRRQQESAYTSVLEMYSGNLEKELEQIDDFLLESIMIEGNARDILESTADLDRYLAEIRMKNSFEETTGHMEHLSGVVWYAPDLDVRVKMVRSKQDILGKKLQQTLDQIIRTAEEEEKTDWFFSHVEENNYLVRILENRGTYMMAWIDSAVIYESVREALPEEKENLCLRVENQIYGEERSTGEISNFSGGGYTIPPVFG